MDLRKERELEHLVSAICDDGASTQDLQALESLLADDPELQDRYWQIMSTHVALGVAVSCESDKSLPGPMARPERAGMPLFSALRSSLRADSQLRFFYYVAAVLLLCLGIGSWIRFGPDIMLALNNRSNSPSINWTVDRIPMITHVSWDGPTFSRDDDQWQLVDGAEAGPVSLQVEQGPSANGYLFCLPPGAAVELVATFDATGENCLSVVELVADDRQPIGKATFNNCGIGPKPWDANPFVTNRRYGVLGRWFERNTTFSPRYFLLTGSHKLANPKPDQDWQLSEMTVLLERNGVIQIGWDDSGPAPPNKGKTYRQDDDFDDLAATLILSLPASTSSGKDSVEFIGQSRGALEGVPSNDNAWRFTLAPGETAVLKVASWATAPNQVFLVHAENNSVYWSTSNTNKANELAKSRDLGAAAVRNNSTKPQDFLLIAAHRLGGENKEDQQWRESQRKLFFEQPGYVILGFEDDGRDNDFDDARVSVLRVGSAGMPHASADLNSSQIH